jgi:hypothetical protein
MAMLPALGLMPGQAEFPPSGSRFASEIVAARDAAETILRQASGATDKPIRGAIALLRPYPVSTGRRLAVAEALARKGRMTQAYSALLNALDLGYAGPLNPTAYDEATRNGLLRMLNLGAHGEMRAARLLAVDIARKSAYGAPSYLAAYSFYAACDIRRARLYWARSIVKGETTPLMPAGSYPALEYSALRMLDKTAYQTSCSRP